MTADAGMTRNPLCTRCPLHISCQTVCIPGEGPVPAEFMIVGEAPGEEEDREGRPFIGRSGRKLRDLLETAGFDLSRMYITNAIKCHPPGNAEPKSVQLNACTLYLEQEIAAVQPRYILAVGGTALKALTGKAGILKKRGEVHRVELPKAGKKDTERSDSALSADLLAGIKVFPVFHPSFILREPEHEQTLAKDLSYFRKLTRGLLALPKDFRYKVVGSSREIAEFLQAARGQTRVFYDIENSDERTKEEKKRAGDKPPRPHQGKLLVIGVGFPGSIIYVFPYEHPEGPNSDAWRSLVRAALKLGICNIPERGAFSPYDDRWLNARGIRTRTTLDPFHELFLLNENEPHGLKYQLRKRYQAPDYETDISFSADESLDDLAKYCAVDVWYPVNKLVPDLERELTAQPKLRRIYDHILQPLDMLTKGIEERGVWLREDVIEQTDRELRLMIMKLELKLKQASPVREIVTYTKGGKEKRKPINWNSGPQKAMLFFSEDGLGLESTKKTDGGKQSTDKEVLKELALDNPLAELLLKYNEARDLLKFIYAWRWYVEHYKLHFGVPIAHPIYKVTGTVTGRLSAEDFNYTQAPRDPRLRRVIGAPPGYVFVEADGSQMEICGVAHVAQERTMIRILRADGDIHKATAATTAGVSLEEVTEEQRQGAKATNFGLLYGQQTKVSRIYAFVKFGVRLSKEEAGRNRAVWFNYYADIEPWHQWSTEHIVKSGQIESFMGRVRHLPAAQSRDQQIRSAALREGFNHQVQSPMNDINSLGAIEIDRMELEGVKVVGLVHDATHFWVREDMLDQTLPIIARTMEETVPLRILPEVFGVTLSVPIKAELKIGASWGDAKKVHIDAPWRLSMAELPPMSSALMEDPHADWDDHLPWDALLRVSGPMLPHLRYLRKRGAILMRNHKAPPTEPLRLWCKIGPGLWSHESEFMNARRKLLGGYGDKLKYALLEAWLHY